MTTERFKARRVGQSLLVNFPATDGTGAGATGPTGPTGATGPTGGGGGVTFPWTINQDEEIRWLTSPDPTPYVVLYSPSGTAYLLMKAPGDLIHFNDATDYQSVIQQYYDQINFVAYSNGGFGGFGFFVRSTQITDPDNPVADVESSMGLGSDFSARPAHDAEMVSGDGYSATVRSGAGGTTYVGDSDPTSKLAFFDDPDGGGTIPTIAGATTQDQVDSIVAALKQGGGGLGLWIDGR